MAYATEHLGFAFTSSVLQCHPFAFARTISTLDHLTKGRIAWNIVTSYLESAGRSFGQPGLPEHDERYDIGDEYLGGMLQAVGGQLAGRCGGQGSPAGHLRRPEQGPRRAPQRQILSGPRLPPGRAVPPAHTGAVPGRCLAARSALCGRTCRGRVHQRPQSPGCWRLYSGHARRSGQARPAARGHRLLDLPQGHHRRHRGRGAPQVRGFLRAGQLRGRAGPAQRLVGH